MRITVFDSDKGDCVLLESNGGSRILCDGGMYKSMQRHAAPHLEGLDIDLAHVSHIDQDHVAGVLQLLQNAVEWLVFDRHDAAGDPIRPPRVSRPPNIARIWNNGFREQITRNRGDIEDLLAHSAPMLQASQLPELVDIGQDAQRISTSVRESLKVSRLIGSDVLDIPINQIPGQRRRSRLIMRRRRQRPVNVGDFQITILGPSEDELEDLREGWDNWLRENRGIRREMDRYVRDRMEAFENGADIDPFDLRDWNGMPDFRGVTVPNVASIVLLIVADNVRVLITGDVQQDILLGQLEESGLMARGGALHFDVLKVPHHGSHHNASEEFCRRVSADHYLFTGIDGRNTNPEIDVINLYWNSRLGRRRRNRAQAQEADGRAFAFYFSSHSSKKSGVNRTHARAVQRRVQRLQGRSGNQMSHEFNRRDFIRIDL